MGGTLKKCLYECFPIPCPKFGVKKYVLFPFLSSHLSQHRAGNHVGHGQVSLSTLGREELTSVGDSPITGPLAPPADHPVPIP